MILIRGFVLSFGISLLIIAAARFLAPVHRDGEKEAAFECGFSPFRGSKERLQIRFFLIGLLFLIFDLEISLIVPYGVVCQFAGAAGLPAYWSLIGFLGVLTLGLIVEWQSGALDWE